MSLTDPCGDGLSEAVGVGHGFRDSQKIMICAGHFKQNGLNKLLKNLNKAIVQRGASVDILSNHVDTEQEIVKRLEKYPNINFNQTVDSDSYLHSKIYYFEKNNIYTAIIGSANFTKGALCSNEELSVMLTGYLEDDSCLQIINYFKGLNSRFNTDKTSNVPFRGVL